MPPATARQSSKRFKFQRTGTEAADLVFNTDPNGQFTKQGNDGLYRVFQKYGNDTGQTLAVFTVSLGTGVGAAFEAMSAGDGLTFTNFDAARNNTLSALFANGLFGDVDDEHSFGGYFAAERAGYGLAMNADATSFSSTGLFGAYESLFGNLLSYAQVPNGCFFDHDGDPTTDAILVAHQLADGTWVRNRSLVNGMIEQIAFGNSGTVVGDPDALETLFLNESGLKLCTDPALTAGEKCLAGEGDIEDLAKFNLTFFLDPTRYQGGDFTLRLEASLPEPSSLALAGLALAGLALAGLGFGARRRKTAA